MAATKWTVRVSASARNLDLETQVRIAEELRAGVTVDAETDTLTARFTVTASTLRQATDEALKAFRILPAKPSSVLVQDLDEWEAEQSAPRSQDLVGIAETAGLLNVSRQRVGQLVGRPDFPAPIARLSAGPVWTRHSIDAFNRSWSRKITGRPRTKVG